MLGRVRADRRTAAGPAAARGGGDRRLRAARGRRAVDPARGRDGRRGPRRRARGPSGAALVRAAARGRARRSRSTRARRASPAGSCRSPPSPRCCSARRRCGDALARRMPGPAAEAAAITIAATVGTAPLMALHFEQVSLAALPANLLAAPAIAPMMWLGVLAAAAAQIAEPLAAPFSALTAPLLVYVQQVAHVTAATPLSVVEIHAPPAAIAAGSAIAGRRAALVARRCDAGASHDAPRRRGRRDARTARGGAGAADRDGAARARRRAIAGARRVPPRPRPDELVVSFLDIGQGDATLIQLDGRPVLVDTGPARRPDPRSGSTEAGVEAARRADAHPRRGRPRGRRAGGDRALRAAARRRRRRRLALAPCSGCCRPRSPRRAARQMTPERGPGDRGRRPALRGPVAAAAAARRAADRQPERPRGRRPARGRRASRCCSPPTPRATSPPPLALEPVDVLKVAHHGSADPGLPALLERLRPRDRRDRGRPPQHLRPSDALDAGRARAGRPDGRCGPTATARSACTSCAAGCGCGDEGPHADSRCRTSGSRARRPRRAAEPRAAVRRRSRNRHPSVRSNDTVAAVCRIPSRKGLLHREIASPCGHVAAAARGGRARGAGRPRRVDHGRRSRRLAPRPRRRQRRGDRDPNNVSRAASPSAAGQLWGSNSGRHAPSARATVPAGTTLPAGQTYRLRQQRGHATPARRPDRTRTGITDDRRHPDPQRRRDVRRSTRSAAWPDGAGDRLPRGRRTPARVPDRQRQQRLHPQGGGTQDTDDNAADFEPRADPTSAAAASCRRRDAQTASCRSPSIQTLGRRQRRLQRPRRSRSAASSPASTTSTARTSTTIFKADSGIWVQEADARPGGDDLERASSSPASAATRPTRRRVIGSDITITGRVETKFGLVADRPAGVGNDRTRRAQEVNLADVATINSTGNPLPGAGHARPSRGRDPGPSTARTTARCRACACACPRASPPAAARPSSATSSSSRAPTAQRLFRKNDAAAETTPWSDAPAEIGISPDGGAGNPADPRLPWRSADAGRPRPVRRRRATSSAR